MPRMEPFSPGQVFNVSQLDRIHVLPPAITASSIASTGGSVSNPMSAFVPTILKSVSRKSSSASFTQSADKETR